MDHRKMNKLVLVIMLLAVSAAAEEDIDYHETHDDNFDFTSVSKDDFRDMVKCMTDEGPCSPLLASYRQHYPAAVEEGCKRCNQSQKRIGFVYFDRAGKEMPEELEKIKRKYDPKGIYWDKFIKKLKTAYA